ncbi:Hypothetical predicted protein [Marmota monax]|uniref:Lipoxygenase domain-containing protein n=1 Tax=Marmota monax TaxID=9995 RepID=A0A5E4D4Q7_MARMO|nr:Hypothetical predicted protein [Marmota monax]
MRFHEGKKLDYEWTQRQEKVHQHWKEDELFGYLFLNGANPILLRRSTSLPSRLVLPSGTEELGAQLKKELQNGSLFEAVFILLDGIPTNVIQREKQYLAAEDGTQWEAATYGHPDFQLHELQYHLLNTHLLGEVIAVATMRCLPGLHPVFKLHPPGPILYLRLLAPHIHNTMEINTRGQIQFNSDEGIFAKAVSTGGGGHLDLARRAMTQLTYCSLCPPDGLADRGLLGIPSALYAHDALAGR